MPLPSDISIGTPAADVRAADAAFSGAWGNGAWYGGRPTALIVERVDADGSAHLIYAVGAWAYPNAAEWQRIVGHIKDGRLGFHLPDRNSYAGCQMEYRMVAPGALEGDATNGHGWRGDAFLQCIAGPPSTIVATVALPYRRIWRQIWMAERSPKEGDQPVKLEATLYRTRLPGRQPLVILNHGSQELHEKYTARFKAGSRFFLGRGYSVVVPMRRGYGRSGGPLGMGSDGAVEDLDAVVDNMRAKPWVDPARIIVGGWSRGGLLSIVQAGRYPDKLAGVLNFSRARGTLQDPGSFATAGKTAGVPELWLYDKNDSYVSLQDGRTSFNAFRANGGKGDFMTFASIYGAEQGAGGQGHALFQHVGMWKAAVVAYLRRLDGG